MRIAHKPQRREIEVAIDFVGFRVGNLFVVGYGTDYAGKYRHLPYIGIANKLDRAAALFGKTVAAQPHELDLGASARPVQVACCRKTDGPLPQA